MKKYIYIAAVVALCGVVSGAYLKGRSDVRTSIELAQAEGRIKILKLVQTTDSDADNAAADELCKLLGGCDVPVDGSD